MPVSFRPTWVAASLTEISADFLTQQGIKLLMMDFDNTIVPYTTDTPTVQMSAWLKEMQTSGLQLCVVSNSHNRRVPDFCREQSLACITHAGKPGTRGIRNCLKQFRIPKEQAVLVGDQIFTDTLGGNLAGVKVILIPAIHNHNIWMKARGVVEIPFRWASRKRRMEK